MEGISHEVCSLAGTLQLGKLVVYYDDNGISIDGDVEGWFSDDDTEKRFEAYGWQVQKLTVTILGCHHPSDPKCYSWKKINPHSSSVKPWLAQVHPTSKAWRIHMAHPLARMKSCLPVKHSSGITKPLNFQTIFMKGGIAQLKVKHYNNHGKVSLMLIKTTYPELASELLRRVNGDLPANFETQAQEFIKACQDNPENIATRKASQNSINAHSHYCQSCWAVLLIWQGQIWLGLKMPSARRWCGR